MASMWRKKEREATLTERATVSLLLLARPQASEYEHGRIVRELRTVGVNSDISMRASPGGYWSPQLEDWKGRFAMGGYLHGKLQTPEMTSMLKQILVEEYGKDRGGIERASHHLSFDYASAVIEGEEARIVRDWEHMLYFPGIRP